MGGAFDPPLDMAGGTADMAGEEEKGSNTCKSSSTVFYYPLFLVQEGNNQVLVFSQDKL